MKRTLPTSWGNTDQSSDSMDIDDSTDENILSEDSPSEETDSIVDSETDSEDSFETDSEDSFFDAFAVETEEDGGDSDDNEEEKIEIFRKIRKAAEDSETDFFHRMSRLRIEKRPSDDTNTDTDIESSLKKMRLR